MKYDLHCHSTCSDGTYAPTEVVQRAHAAGVNVLALTDHVLWQASMKHAWPQLIVICS